MTQDLVDKVVELRRRTDAPAMVCRKALARNEWDLDKATAYVKDLEGRYPDMLVTTSQGRYRA